MKIIGHLDFEGKEIDKQIELATELKVDELILRYLNEETKISDISAKDVKTINQLLKQNKKNIYAIDPLIEQFNYEDSETTDFVLKEYEKAVNAANLLKVNNIIFRLPIIKDIISEFELMKEFFDNIIEIARRSNKTLLIRHENTTTSNIAYILKKYNNNKHLSVIFSPSDAILNSDSPLAGYRVLKDYFNVFIASDIDSINNPELLGYGRVNIIDLFKRMKRDKYKGDVIIDERFVNLFNNEEIKKVPFYKKLFNKKSLFDKYLEGYALRVFPNEKDRIPTIHDIYHNQINVINIVFNR